jgi:hypothetical protein
MTPFQAEVETGPAVCATSATSTSSKSSARPPALVLRSPTPNRASLSGTRTRFAAASTSSTLSFATSSARPSREASGNCNRTGRTMSVRPLSPAPGASAASESLPRVSAAVENNRDSNRSVRVAAFGCGVPRRRRAFCQPEAEPVRRLGRWEPTSRLSASRWASSMAASGAPDSRLGRLEQRRHDER